jgi:hypothetical protein
MESMKYVITDGKNFIGYNKSIGKNCIVEKFRKAVKFKYARANVILSKLSDNITNVAEWKIVSTTQVRYDFTDALELDIDGIIEDLEVNYDLLAKRKKVLALEYLEIEREITDIYHAMEFYDLDESKGYKCYKLLRESLIRRRKIKDETQKIDYILEGGINGVVSGETRKKIEAMKERQYTPRVLTELFSQ